MKVTVLDAGNSVIKAKSADESEIAFPHALVEISESKYLDTLKLYGRGAVPADYLRVNGRFYVVGQSAENHGVLTQERGPARYHKDYYGVFVASVLGRLYGANTEVAIFGSHPPAHVQYADKLMSAALGHYDIEIGGKRKAFSVTYANVFDEPAGGLMNVMLTKDGRAYQNPQLKGARTLVIDIGGGTTDFLVMLPDGDIDYGIADSIPAGIISVIKDFEQSFRSRYPEQTQSTDYLLPERVREAVVSGQFRGGGKVFDCLDEARQARDKLINRVLQMVRTQYGGGLRYDAILITGGGGALLYDYLAPHLENTEVYPADELEEMHLANVRGGLKLWRLYCAIGVIAS